MSAGDWRSQPDRVRPTVVLLGGFLTSPILYRPFRRRLLERGAAGVVVANVWTPDWLLASWRGIGPIATRAARALVAATQLAATSEESRGAPLLVIGHSAGGILARVLTAPEPFQGRRFAMADRIAAVTTLGSPHVVSAAAGIGGRVGALAATFADRQVPGAYFAPRVGYVSVASSAVLGRVTGAGRERIAYRLYRELLGELDGTGSLDGDGLVPIPSALLPGATPVLLHGIAHGPGSGQAWYGSDPAIDVWWPVAVESWRAAIMVRAAGVIAPGNAPASASMWPRM